MRKLVDGDVDGNARERKKKTGIGVVDLRLEGGRVGMKRQALNKVTTFARKASRTNLVGS